MLLREEDGRATAEIVCAGRPLALLVRDGHVAPVGATRVARTASSDDRMPGPGRISHAPVDGTCVWFERLLAEAAA